MAVMEKWLSPEGAVNDEVCPLCGEMKKLLRRMRLQCSVMPDTESSRGATGPPERAFAFVLELREVVLAKRLKPTTEITKKSSTSRERQILRTILDFVGLMG